MSFFRDNADKLAAQNGFELHPDLHMGRLRTPEQVNEWPLLAYVYPSHSKRGYGRVGDAFYMVPARKKKSTLAKALEVIKEV